MSGHISQFPESESQTEPEPVNAPNDHIELLTFLSASPNHSSIPNSDLHVFSRKRKTQEGIEN